MHFVTSTSTTQSPGTQLHGAKNGPVTFRFCRKSSRPLRTTAPAAIIMPGRKHPTLRLVGLASSKRPSSKNGVVRHEFVYQLLPVTRCTSLKHVAPSSRLRMRRISADAGPSQQTVFALPMQRCH